MPPLPVEEVIDQAETDAAPPAVTPPLTYDPESGKPRVTRRQFRFLLALTLVNTLMLGGFVAGPGISKLTRGWWDDYKRWRADRQAAKQAKIAREKFLADYAKLLARRDPADRVVYDEDQERAARLIKSDGYTEWPSGGNFDYFTPKPWQFPAVAPWPTEMLTIAKRGAFVGAPLYLGGRKSPSGDERLVFVVLDARIRSKATSGRSRAGTEELERSYMVETYRALHAGTYKSGRDNFIELGTDRVTVIVQPPEKRSLVLWKKSTSWENGDVAVRHGQVMRFFAGHADPADPSHFTIEYEYNGQPGLIDGWLRDDDSVVIEPRVGRIIQSDPTGRARVWDMDAEPAATRPVGGATKQ